MITYTLVGLLSLTIICLASYLFSINLLYKKKNKRAINIKNYFGYEIVPQKGENTFFINVLLLIAMLSFLTATILNVVTHFGAFNLVISIASLLLVFILVALPFIDLKYLKEHLYLDIGMVVLFFLINGLLTYSSYQMCKVYDYKNINGIIALVISATMLIVSLVFFINPKLFNLSGDKHEDGTVTRPKVIHLALVEWLVTFFIPILFIPIILLSTIM